MLSSSEEIFNEAKGPYQEALAKSGYDYQLKYKKVNLQDLNKQKKKRQRYKQMFYCTPPHDEMVETPVGALILRALENTIPPGHVLHPLLNKHTVKIGYSNMPSLMKKISNHNIKISKKESELQEYDPDDQEVIEDERPCNCDLGRHPCPLDGRCQVDGENCVYTCTVTREDSDVVKTYCGSTQDFKQRWYGHNSAERHQKNSNTTLSRYLWQHKLNDPPLTYNLKWKIIDRGRQFNPVTKICRLCSIKSFIFYITKKSVHLIICRAEIFQPCPHKKKIILNNIKF